LPFTLLASRFVFTFGFGPAKAGPHVFSLRPKQIARIDRRRLFEKVPGCGVRVDERLRFVQQLEIGGGGVAQPLVALLGRLIERPEE
jgi:hypothetical protein